MDFRFRDATHIPACLIAVAFATSLLVADAARPAAAQGVQCIVAPRVAPPKEAPPTPRRAGEPASERFAAKLSDLQAVNLCPDGQVPQARLPAAGRPNVPKGNPLLRPLSDQQRGSGTPRQFFSMQEMQTDKFLNPSTDATCDGNRYEPGGHCYYYSGAMAQRQADGAGMVLSVHRPRYFSGPGMINHTLAELAVQGGPNNGHIVEIGWRVSADTYGNADPHLFVFRWINGDGDDCYDDRCGWQQVSNVYYPGQNIGNLVGRDVYVGYVFREGNWWAWFGNEWLGYYPGSIWNGAFQKSTLLQWFGEVASLNGIPPRIEMGAGMRPSTADGAYVFDTCDYDVAKKSCLVIDDPNAQTKPAGSAKYYGLARVGEGRFRYGGPGQ